MIVQEKTYTVADLWELSHSPEYAGMRLELVEGELIVMSPSGAKHGGLASMLDRRIGNFVEEHDLGYTTTAEAGYVLFQNPDPEGNDTVFAPDVGFIAAERLPDGLPDGYVPFAPDLAVEVVSPNDKAADVQQKVATYLKYGTRLIWVVYPKTQSVVVHTRDGAKTYTIDDTLDGGEVLPGFRLPLRDVFTGE